MRQVSSNNLEKQSHEAVTNNRNFLDISLTYIAGPQSTRRPVETETPGVTQPISVNLFPETFGIALVRIIRRNSVGEITGSRVYINPNNLEKQSHEAVTNNSNLKLIFNGAKL